MVIQHVVYQCGCGFRTELLVSAMEHVRKTGHSITVQGVVRETESHRRRK